MTDLDEALEKLDRLEEHMNKHGSFGMSEPEPWAVCRKYAKTHLALLKKIEAGQLAIVPVDPTEEMQHRGLSPFIAHATSPMFSANEPCGPIYKVMVKAINQQEMLAALNKGG